MPLGCWGLSGPDLVSCCCCYRLSDESGVFRSSVNRRACAPTDLLILGLGSDIRPLSPETKRHITSLGMRVEVLDTQNAASQFNLLATERGVDDVAAALIPIGWREGVGAR